MHELSLAQGLFDQVTGVVPADDLRKVSSIHVRLGLMSGVVREALDTSYSVIAADTPLEHSKLSFEEIPFRITCRSCGQTSSNEIGFAVCGVCGSLDTYLKSGRELEVVAVELAD